MGQIFHEWTDNVKLVEDSLLKTGDNSNFSKTVVDKFYLVHL